MSRLVTPRDGLYTQILYVTRGMIQLLYTVAFAKLHALNLLLVGESHEYLQITLLEALEGYVNDILHKNIRTGMQ